MPGTSQNIKRELSIKSITENLMSVRKFISEAALDAGIDEENIGKITLAVDEACTNIIKHAYKYSPEGNIHISIKADRNKIEIRITDEGLHFNPNLIPDPDIVEYHKQKKVGGLGMFLMKKLMDEVKYNTISSNKNQVVLVKHVS